MNNVLFRFAPRSRRHLVAATLALGMVYLWAGAATLVPISEVWDFRRVLWLPSGLAVVALLLAGWRLWPGIMLGAFATTWFTGGPTLHVLGTAVANTGEALLAVYLLRLADFDPRLSRGRDVVAFVVLGAGLPVALTTPISVTTLSLVGGVAWDVFPRMWFLWGLTHAMGVLIVAPVVLTLAAWDRDTIEGSAAEGLALLVSLVVVGAMLFGPVPFGPTGSHVRVAFVPLPLLLWAAFRFGPSGGAVSSLVISGIAMVGTVGGHGPFVTPSQDTNLFLTWAFVNVAAITTLTVAAIVAQRRLTLRQLHETAGLLRTVLESTGDGILVLDASGAVRHANQRFADLWGLTPLALAPGAGPAFLDRIARQSDDPEGFLSELCERLESDDAYSETVRLGDGRVYQHFFYPLPGSSGPAGQVWSCRDITDAVRAEAETRRLERQVQHGQKLESLGVLAGGIAHDFNNLLLAILGNADLSLSTLPADSPARHHLDQIVTASQRAANLTEQMLAYSGRGAFIVERLDLAAAVREMANLLEVSVSKRAELVLDFAPDLPAIDADRAQIQQIIMNLITNASDALGDETGTITVSVGLVECDRDFLASCYVDDNLPPGPYVFMEVRDTGQGMDPMSLARIFDPFYSSKKTGRGLGLAATLGIVRGHRGAIRVQSEVGVGSRFSVYFPATTEPVPVERERTSGDHGWTGSGTVLVVDDEEMVRKLAREILRRAGFHVLEAADGLEALAVYREHPEAVDLVLLDLTMPRLDGLETFHELRLINPDVRVLLTSGFSESEMNERAEESGVAGFIQKPYRTADLISLVRSTMLGVPDGESVT